MVLPSRATVPSRATTRLDRPDTESVVGRAGVEPQRPGAARGRWAGREQPATQARPSRFSSHRKGAGLPLPITGEGLV